MMKYLDNISKRLKEVKKGMINNNDDWKQAPENTEYVDSQVMDLNRKNSEIEELRRALSQKYSEARLLSEEKKLILTKLEKRAIGIHADSPEKLIEYGIKY